MALNRRNGRSLVTFAGFAVPGLLIATTGFLTPLASGSINRGAEQIRLPASDTVSWCPGPLDVAGQAAGTDEEFTTSPVPPTTVQSASVQTSAPDGSRAAAGVRSQALGGQENFTVGSSGGFASGDDSVTEPTLVIGQAESEHPALVSAGQTVQASEGDFAGLAALSCVRPRTQVDFTAGDTSTGVDSRLLIANPSQAPITVAISLTGEMGPITPAGDDTLSLQPGEQRSVVLGALAPEQTVLGVRAEATGGLMAAVLQQTRLDGLTPRGIEYEAPARAAAETAEVPLAVDGRGVVRVTNTGDAATTATIEYIGTEGPVEIERDSAAVPAHATAQIELGEVPAGVVRITAAAPVVAGAEVERDIGDSGSEFALMPAVEPLGAGQLLALPRGPEATLMFGPAAGEVSLAGVREDGTVTDARALGLARDRSSAVRPDELFGEAVVGVVLDSPGGTAVHAAAAAATETGLSGLVIPAAPTGIGYRDIRLHN
ncbi:DUF5719 family protein [Brevibacterium daeguense]|uniref:DUF5719 family protein n=1 Tax=Brevibacterium daeguense TaxID=909936 RepID=A0ABP8EMF0_9MICO|nr:DUF5719 family protein [Brevibacterium daeguense]